MSKTIRLPIAFLASALLAACAPGPTAPASRAESPNVVARLSTLVNDHRATLGCPGLVAHGGVAGVALAHSEDMAARGFFDHVNPDGESPFDRLREAGITWRGGAAENLASGRTSADEVFSSWLASSGHRKAIETCAYTHHGIGVAESYWTHLFLTDPTS